MGNISIATYMLLLFISFPPQIDAQVCGATGSMRGSSPPGVCNTENDSECCVPGQTYSTYTCSPPVSSNTPAQLTLNGFDEGEDGGGSSKCDEKYHSNDELVVALSTGWYDGGSRCNGWIMINGNGQSVRAMVVDECDSTAGCDEEHAYQPPCHENIVDASKAVWEALGVPSDDRGDMSVTWSDA